MLMSYHIGRLVRSSLCVGAFVAVGIWWCSFCIKLVFHSSTITDCIDISAKGAYSLRIFEHCDHGLNPVYTSFLCSLYPVEIEFCDESLLSPRSPTEYVECSRLQKLILSWNRTEGLFLKCLRRRK